MELYYTLNYSYHKIYTTQMNRLQFPMMKIHQTFEHLKVESYHDRYICYDFITCAHKLINCCFHGHYAAHMDRLITGFEHPVNREGYIRVTARMDRT